MFLLTPTKTQRLQMVFEEIRSDADFDRITDQYARAKKDPVFATMRFRFDDAENPTYGALVKRNVGENAPDRFVAVIDCRGGKLARRFFTRWHEIAHRLATHAEEDCPKILGPRLLARAGAAHSDVDIACVLAKRTLENWFKAAAASLAGVCGLPDDLTVPANPEDGSGDTWLTRQMQRKNRRRKYTKPADAVELTQRMDLQQCRNNSTSFDKLCRELEARLPQAPNEAGSHDQAAPPTTDMGTAS